MLLAGTGNATFGFNNGVGSAALFYYPTAITCDTALRMAYICDSNNQLIRTLNLSNNNVSTLAGSGQTATIDGVGTLAQFAFPGGIVFYRPDHHLDIHNNNTVLYIAQYSGNAYIRKIDVDTANVTTVASLGGSLRSALRACIAKDGAVLYVSMFGYSESSIARVDLRNGSNVTTLAGSSTGFADGVSVHARFCAPQGTALNSDESVLIIADTKNYRIRQLRLLDNSVITIAGTGVATSQRDGIGLQATFIQPYGGKWHCFTAASRPSEKEVCGFLVADTNLIRFVAIEAATPSASLSSSVSTLSASQNITTTSQTKTASLVEDYCNRTAGVGAIVFMPQPEVTSDRIVRLLSNTSSSGVVLLQAMTPSQPAVNIAPNAPPIVRLRTTPASRTALLGTPALILNISIQPVSGSRLNTWVIGNVTMSSGQSIVPHTSSGLAGVLLEAPITGWLDADVPVVQDATINFAITVFCGEAVMLVIDVSVPVPGIAKQLTAQVTAATRYSQVASVLSGGASSGSALGRVMTTRSMVMCSADSAVGGGLVDLELSLYSDASSTSGPVAARSAIVSNIVLIAVVLAVLVALCVAWSALAGSSLVDASRVFCLPSSTLSMWTALLPSTAASATLLFGRIGDTACVAIDVALAVVGATVVIIPCVALGALWHVSCGGATGPRWVCTKASSGLRTPHSAMQRGLRRVWKWSNVGSHMLQPVWAVLLEYRILWYAVLDTTMLAAFAVLGVVSGLGTSTGVCRALTMVALLLMIVQLCVVLIVRPFTTLFSLVHTSVTLSLTCVGLLAQLLFMLTSPTATDGMWLVDFALGCNFAAVGVSAVKMTLDAWELLMALRRRGMRLQEQRAPSRDALPLAELLLLVDKSPTEPPPAELVEGPPGHLQQDIISAANVVAGLQRRSKTGKQKVLGRSRPCSPIQ